MSARPSVEKEVFKIYDKWLHSYLSGDIETYSLYLDDQYHFIGSTGNEEFLDKKATISFFEATAEQLAGKTEIRNSKRTLETFGDLVFITELLDAYFLSGTEWNFYGRFRFTSVMRKSSEGWRFIYQHFSMPDSKAQEGETIGYDQISEENLKLREAIGRRTVELEQKSRELEIEAALERVRSRSMAMQQSEELAEVIQVVYDEFVGLNILVDHAGFILDYKERDDMHIWLADHQQGVPSEITIPYFDSPHWNSFVEAKSKGEDFFANLLNFEEKNKFYKGLMDLIPPMPEETVQNILKKPGLVISTVMLDNVGLYIENYSTTPFTDKENKTLMRFGKVFEQTYTRFRDLQKAEEQAREAQIEAALEKVRSRTMAMRHSDELAEASFLLDEQVRGLGMKTWGCAFNIFEENHSTEWFGNEAGVLNTYTVPREGIFKEYYQKHLEGETFYVKEFAGQNCIDHYEFMSGLPVIGDVLFKLKETNDGFPTFQIDHVAYFKYGYVLFITREHVPEWHEVFKRFAKVFEQTYTRFLDLQKAEAQTREAQVNLAVERVRAKALAMHKSEEILQVVNTLKNEIMGLNIPSVTAATIHLSEPDGKIRVWDLTSIDDERKELEISIDISYRKEDTHPNFFMREVWDRAEDYFVVIQGSDRYPHTVEWLVQNGYSEQAREFEAFIEATGIEQAYHPTVPLQKGRMSIDMLEEPTHEVESILKKMAQAFDITYKRFEDLQKAEAQTREAQIEAALEKVRSRSLAMQKSDELLAVIIELSAQLQQLNVRFDFVSF
ncbi:MAG TPA: nuclear transport factor 2 family protein, partial [Cryomorphaceae bacterium]|nr:nuclear transport factor 2 family protein [Cryomorphaceae bacterium]